MIILGHQKFKECELEALTREVIRPQNAKQLFIHPFVWEALQQEGQNYIV